MESWSNDRVSDEGRNGRVREGGIRRNGRGREQEVIVGRGRREERRMREEGGGEKGGMMVGGGG